MIAFEMGLLAIGALLVLSPKLGTPHHHHGVILGLASGLLFGVSDVAIKALTGLMSSDGLGRRRRVAVAPDLHRRVGPRVLRIGPRTSDR